MAKKINPSIVTVLGGPNIRTGEDDIKIFLKSMYNLTITYYMKVKNPSVI